MAYIKINTKYPVYDGMPITFKAPCDCTSADGLTVNSTNFLFKDAHGVDLAGVGDLFKEGAYVKVILDVSNGYAFIQNADTNSYLEGKFAHEHSADDITSGTLPVARGGTGRSTFSVGWFLVGNGSSAFSVLSPKGALESIGAAPSKHEHSADDITSDTLPVARGGTGVTTYAELSQQLNCLTYQTTSYTGTGTYASSQNEIALTCYPIFAIITPWLSGKANSKSALKYFSFDGVSYYDEDFGVFWTVETATSGYTLKWYSNTAAAQFNESGQKYQVLVFGVQA